MAQSYFPITPTDKTPGATGAWTNVDVSALVAAGATGITFEFVNTDAANQAVGARKNGSTDARVQSIRNGSHIGGAIGIDGSGILQVYIGSLNVKFYVTGYFNAGAVFFTNAVDKSLAVTLTWTDIDISADTGTDTAKLGIFEVIGPGSNTSYGFRVKGSTDTLVDAINAHNWAFAGLDASEICQGYTASTSLDFFLAGYIKEGVVVHTNKTNVSLTTTGAYTNLAALGTGAVAGIYEIVSGGVSGLWHIRKKGATDDNYYGATPQHAQLVAACDASQLCEGKISATSVDFYEIGYFDVPPITGSLAVTLDNATVSATGALKIAGSLAATLADATLAATGALAIKGQLAQTLADATLSATGALAVKGSAAVTLEDAVLAAAGALKITGQLAVTLEDATLVATGNDGWTRQTPGATTWTPVPTPSTTWTPVPPAAPAIWTKI